MMKGYSLLICLSPEDRVRNPHMKYRERIGPDIAPHDSMHLLPCNIVQRMCEFVSAAWTAPGSAHDDYVLSFENTVKVGEEMRLAQGTVPTAQARSLRNIQVLYKHFETVDRMFFIQSTAEVAVAGRLRDKYFNMNVWLSKACHVIIQTAPLSRVDRIGARGHFRDFFSAFYSKINAGSFDRLSLGNFSFATLPELVANIMLCGPA